MVAPGQKARRARAMVLRTKGAPGQEKRFEMRVPPIETGRPTGVGKMDLQARVVSGQRSDQLLMAWCIQVEGVHLT